jgi:hypothetical protein
MLKRFCSFIQILLLFPAFAFAADPFAPPQKIQLFYQVIYQTDDDSLPRYKMLIMRGDVAYALLDDTFVKAGDTYKEMTVSKISAKGVLLITADGEQKILVLEDFQANLDKLRMMVKEGKST